MTSYRLVVHLILLVIDSEFLKLLLELSLWFQAKQKYSKRDLMKDLQIVTRVAGASEGKDKRQEEDFPSVKYQIIYV